MLGHYSGFNYGIDGLGGASMSFFYLLSGFVMTVAYGKKSTDPTKPWLPFKYGTFLRNRFARLLPMYYVITTIHLFFFILAAGGTYIYTSSAVNGPVFVLREIMSFSLLNMWVYPFWPMLGEGVAMGGSTSLPVASVTWTVQTMLIFYLTFPLVLRWARSIPKEDRGRKIQELYWIQASWSMSQIFNIASPVTDGLWGYWSGRGFPLGRLPVFMCGCLLAVEVMHGNWSRANRAQGASGGGGVAFELSFSSCCPGCCCGPGPQLKEILPADSWGDKVTNRMATYLMGLGSVIAFQILSHFVLGFGWLGGLVSSISRAFTEIFVMVLFAEIIVGLVICEGKGALYKIMTWKWMKFIGDMSYSLYLVHMAVFMVSHVPFPGDGAGDKFGRLIFSLIFSFVLGLFFTKAVEVPLRNLLKKKRT